MIMKLYGTTVRDGKTMHYYLPPQLNSPAGSHMVQPYRVFDAMSYRWSISIVYNVGRNVIHIADREVAVVMSLENPQVIYRAAQAITTEGRVCYCRECAANRSAVLDGWRPPGYENIKWKLEERDAEHGAI